MVNGDNEKKRDSSSSFSEELKVVEMGEKGQQESKFDSEGTADCGEKRSSCC